jgi:hypothetical protein
LAQEIGEKDELAAYLDLPLHRKTQLCLQQIMLWSSALLALLARNIAAQSNYGSNLFLRFGCSQLVVERTDPLVTPGLNPSPHMHQVHMAPLVMRLDN